MSKKRKGLPIVQSEASMKAGQEAKRAAKLLNALDERDFETLKRMGATQQEIDAAKAWRDSPPPE